MMERILITFVNLGNKGAALPQKRKLIEDDESEVVGNEFSCKFS